MIKYGKYCKGDNLYYRDADVVIGFCLPEGTTNDDISLFFKSPNNEVRGCWQKDAFQIGENVNIN